jgi:hypothetical protein
MRDAVKNWHEALNGGNVDVADLQKQVKRLRRQRNFLLSIIVTAASAYVRKIMDGQVKK